jgi:hypothetical protein
MSKKSVFPLMLDRFMTLYGAPRTENDAGFIREYALALGGYSDSVLEKAASRIIADHVFPSWPILGQCVKVCNAVAAELAPPVPIKRVDLPPRTPEELARVQEVMRKFRESMQAKDFQQKH